MVYEACLYQYIQLLQRGSCIEFYYLLIYIQNTSRDIIAEGHQHLNEEDKANIAIIQKYNISQESILNAWRSSQIKGKEELPLMLYKYHLLKNNLKQIVIY